MRLYFLIIFTFSTMFSLLSQDNSSQILKLEKKIEEQNNIIISLINDIEALKTKINEDRIVYTEKLNNVNQKTSDLDTKISNISLDFSTLEENINIKETKLIKESIDNNISAYYRSQDTVFSIAGILLAILGLLITLIIATGIISINQIRSKIKKHIDATFTDEKDRYLNEFTKNANLEIIKIKDKVSLIIEDEAKKVQEIGIEQINKINNELYYEAEKKVLEVIRKNTSVTNQSNESEVILNDYIDKRNLVKKENNDWNEEDWFIEAYTLIKASRYHEAIEALNMCLNLKPDYVDAYINLSICYSGINEVENALQNINKAINLDEKNYLSYHVKAVVLGKFNRYAESKVIFEEALKLKSNDAELLTDYGIILTNSDLYNEAITVLEKSLSIKKSHIAYNTIAVAFRKQENLIKSKKYLTKALLLKPDFDIALSNIAEVYLKESNYEEAINYCNKSIEVNPENADSYYNLACIYSLMNNKEIAILNLTKAIELNSEKYQEKVYIDEDLDNIRESKEFINLIKKYYKGKSKVTS